MTRLIIALGLASTLLSPAVFASNDIFGFSPSDPTCTACLDDAFLACPGFYQDRSYAECMCAGVGDTKFVTCTSTSCDPGVNSPANAARMWYNYCTQFFPAELCPGAEPYMNSDIYQDQCSAAAIAGGGLGSGGSSGSGSSGSGSGSGAGSGTGSGSGSGSDSGSAPASSSSRVTSTPTNTASGTGFTSGTTSSSKPSGSSGANAIMIPALGVLSVLGIQLVNLLM
ncbi:hypothetical protein B0T25DRAFT_633578 [Lasiosphaeria hispida]|uniref:Extracellular membrane protein CFEM domain-containing protein n=1 Tax=Lasiosphaeria hispida TaxID=260671 RepID=A0AAJ0MAJ9_9PEZI|nr:hypothetical protein B0T25DRAFT_633578 [Lasiosphaeria hispida]